MSASLIILVLVGLAVGGGVGVLLEGMMPGTRVLAIVAGFTATIVASIARYKVFFLRRRKDVDEARIPMVVVVNAAIASIAGSLAAHDLMGIASDQISPSLMSAIAGLLSAILMALLMITYHSSPNTRG